MSTAPRHREDRTALARALFPDLAEQLDAAYARHADPAGVAAGTGLAGADGLDAWLDAEAARLRAGDLSGAAFAGLGDERVRHRFEAAFELAARVLSRLGLSVPEPEEFEAAGVDLAALGAACAAEDRLTPVPAPHGLGAEDWRALYAGDPELLLASEIVRDFAELDRVAEPGIPRVSEVDARGRSLSWTLRLIPADEAPPLLGLAHASGPHPSLPEMLLLQAMRAAAGETPVDQRSFTWLAGTLGGGALAARAIYDDAERAVRVSSRGVSNQGPHLGARPPVG